MFEVLQQRLFGVTLGLSVLVHAAVACWWGRVEFTPPEQVTPQQGKVSVRLRPSMEAQPKPTEKPVEKQPELIVLPTPVPEVVPAPLTQEPDKLPVPVEQPVPVEPDPRPPERVKVAQKEPPKKPTEAKPSAKVASVASTPSPASKESEGAIDELPREAINPLPRYPTDAEAARLEGTAKLLVKIDAFGRVSEVYLKESCGVPSLDASAIAAVRRWVFYPAKRNGRPVPCQVVKPIWFYHSANH